MCLVAHRVSLTKKSEKSLGVNTYVFVEKKRLQFISLQQRSQPNRTLNETQSHCPRFLLQIFLGSKRHIPSFFSQNG
jgi:hypothetical protein